MNSSEKATEPLLDQTSSAEGGKKRGDNECHTIFKKRGWVGVLQYAEKDDWQSYGDIKRSCNSTAKVAFQSRLSVKHKSSSWKTFIVNFHTELWHWIKLAEQHFTYFTETLYATLVYLQVTISLFFQAAQKILIHPHQ